MMLGRARQAHHGIEDVEIKDLEAEGARAWQNFLEPDARLAVVLLSLAGTVLLVGGVGVLSVMLISFSDRRYEIGLRKAMGASDGEILVQFLLEALRARGARRARVGTFGGAALCKALLAEVPLRPRRQPDGPRRRLGRRARRSRSSSASTRDPRLAPVADGGDEINGPAPPRAGASSLAP